MSEADIVTRQRWQLMGVDIPEPGVDDDGRGRTTHTLAWFAVFGTSMATRTVGEVINACYPGALEDDSSIIIIHRLPSELLRTLETNHVGMEVVRLTICKGTYTVA